MPRTNVDEVFNDFKNAQFKINYDHYDPNSDAFMTALHLGLMWLVMRECGGDKVKNEGIEDSSSATANSAENDITEELHDAKKYWQMYLSSKDDMYKSMAGDELRHAIELIRRANLNMPAGLDKAALKSYEEEYYRMLNSIKSA